MSDVIDDYINKQAVLDLINADWKYENLEIEINNLPSVTPQPKTGHCKDCKWWKDSDGKYRRGCGAESQCPINTHTVYCGEGYCYMFEPQKSGVEDNKGN